MDKPNLPLSYRFSGRARRMGGMCAACVAMACGLLYHSKTNHSGMRLQGILLSVEEATIAYACFAGFFAFCATGFAAMLVNLRLSKRAVTLSQDGLTVPRTALVFDQRHMTIPLQEIRSIAELVVLKKDVLRVIHKNGQVDIDKERMPSDDTYVHLRTALEELLAHRYLQERQARPLDP